MIVAALRDRLTKSRRSLSRGFAQLLGAARIEDEDLDDLEDVLIAADVGVTVSQQVVARLRAAAKSQRVPDAAALYDVVRQEMVTALEQTGPLPTISGKPYVMLVVGVNGVGKTTSVAKIANRLKGEGRSVLLAAGDTFRAAAVEQLQAWADRLQIPVVAQHQGADAAAVAHDALSSAVSRGVDVLIIDTAGRQHTHNDLMEQLRKIKRVVGKVLPGAPHEIMQVLDSTTGQNALSQLRHFNDAVSVDSLCLTKLDGTAKGGVVLAIASEFRLPIRYIGVGEGLDDLRPFDARSFVDALVQEHP